MKNVTISHPSWEKLAAFDLGYLRAGEWAEIEQHVAVCDECCLRLEAVPQDSLLAQLREAVSKSGIQVERRLPDTCDLSRGATPPPAAPSRPAAPEMPPELANHPRYRVLELLGAGGMGVVYKVEHRLMERVVALKVINPRLTERPELVERFRQEVRVAARLVHPNIVAAHDAEQAGDLHFLVMEFVEGTSLDRLIEQHGPFPVATACDWVRQAALGLHHAFEQGMVHRDIKPANLLLTPPGQIKILDFGLARFASENRPAGTLTQVGELVGTPDYMAPEQAVDARNADIRADIYSLGCTLYHLLAGRLPFPDGTPFQKLTAHQERRPQPLTELRGDMPPELVRILERMLAKDPAQRYQTPAEIAQQLSSLAQGIPVVRRRTRNRWYVVAAATMMLALAGWSGFAVWSGMDKGRHHTETDGPGAVKPERLGPKAESDDPLPADANETAAAVVYPTAILAFSERGAGVKEYGAKVTDLLFAKLSAKPELYLVDREDLKKTLEEQELNLSGAVKPGEATKVGQLTGAKLLVTGSVLQVDKRIHVVAKIIGTETSRVAGASVEGKAGDELGPLIDKLVDKLTEAIGKQADKLVAKPLRPADREAALNAKLKKAKRPVVWIKITERHIGQATIDPAVQTEVSLLCKGTGFELVDPDEGARAKADVIITGEGFSEFASRHGNLISVKARVEVKAVDRKTDKVLATDRQTAVVVDLTEQIAGKAALQQAAATLAERLLPKLVKE